MNLYAEKHRALRFMFQTISGFYVVNESMRTEDLMEISGVVQRWKQKDDGEIYLVCKLECPWGSKRYGPGLVKCNCKKESRKIRSRLRKKVEYIM